MDSSINKIINMLFNAGICRQLVPDDPSHLTLIKYRHVKGIKQCGFWLPLEMAINNKEAVNGGTQQSCEILSTTSQPCRNGQLSNDHHTWWTNPALQRLMTNVLLNAMI